VDWSTHPLDDLLTKLYRQQAAQARMQKNQIAMMNLQLTISQKTQEALDLANKRQQDIINQAIQTKQMQREEEERRLHQSWEERNRRIWEQVDKAAALVEARLEVDRKKAEAEARKLQEEKEKKEKAEHERREAIEAEKRRVAEEKAKAAEEERKRKEAEEQERIKVEEKQRLEKEQLSKFEAERRRSGLTTTQEDWAAAMAINQVR
jgi:dTMP kinase